MRFTSCIYQGLFALERKRCCAAPFNSAPKAIPFEFVMRLVRRRDFIGNDPIGDIAVGLLLLRELSNFQTKLDSLQ